MLKTMVKKFYKNPFIKHRALVLMLLPVMLYYIIFHYVPMYGIIISFKDFRIIDGIQNSPWVGFKHFESAFNNNEFWRVFKNTIIISGLKLIFGFPAPIIFALMLNEIRKKAFKKIVQTLSYLPHFISWVVLSGILMSFLSPSTGPINALIKLMGFDPIFFVADRSWFRTLIVVSSIWKTIGWSSIIYLASMSGINLELYEAAILDGAGKLKQAVHVTIPSIMPVVVIMFIFAVGSIVNDDFDQIFNLYNSAVYSVGDVLSTYIYRKGLEGMKYSYSAAVGFFKNGIAFLLIVTTNTITKKFSDFGLW